MAGTAFAFKKDDAVLAYHGPLIYEAKVLDRAQKDALDGALRLRLYLLHYEGCVSRTPTLTPTLTLTLQ